MSPKQPELFPEPAKPGFHTMDVDAYTKRVAEAAPTEPYLEQDNRTRRSVGLPATPADLAHHHPADAQSDRVEKAELAQDLSGGWRAELDAHRPDGYSAPVPSMLDRRIEHRKRIFDKPEDK